MWGVDSPCCGGWKLCHSCLKPVDLLLVHHSRLQAPHALVNGTMLEYSTEVTFPFTQCFVSTSARCASVNSNTLSYHGLPCIARLELQNSIYLSIYLFVRLLAQCYIDHVIIRIIIITMDCYYMPYDKISLFDELAYRRLGQFTSGPDFWN